MTTLCMRLAACDGVHTCWARLAGAEDRVKGVAAAGAQHALGVLLVGHLPHRTGLHRDLQHCCWHLRFTAATKIDAGTCLCDSWTNVLWTHWEWTCSDGEAEQQWERSMQSSGDTVTHVIEAAAQSAARLLMSYSAHSCCGKGRSVCMGRSEQVAMGGEACKLTRG